MDLLKKLHLKTDKPLVVINAPADCLYLFDEMAVKYKTGKDKPLPQLFLFVLNRQELDHYMQQLLPYIYSETLFWIAYPKKSGTISSDLVEMKGWDIMAQHGFRPQTSVSITADWTGMRYTNAPAKKPSTFNLPAEARNIPGIDFINRTVQLPADALTAVKKHKGLEAYFNGLAFTHKKEHVVAIHDAKKPETRIRRIEKMVEMLLQKMHVK